jgi:hypothetical protein
VNGAAHGVVVMCVVHLQTIYAMGWCNRPGDRFRFRMAIGSFVEEYGNKIQVCLLQHRERLRWLSVTDVLTLHAACMNCPLAGDPPGADCRGRLHGAERAGSRLPCNQTHVGAPFAHGVQGPYRHFRRLLEAMECV